MTEKIPNVQLRAWRNERDMTRAQMAEALTRTPTGDKEGLRADEERVRRWEVGEVPWPSALYRKALSELTGDRPEALGFVPPENQAGRGALAGRVMPQYALQAEAELFDTMELLHMTERSDIGPGTVEAIHEAVDLLCRAYPVTPARILKQRTKERLRYVTQRLQGRTSFAQHRELLVAAGWLSLLLGCVHFDLGEREMAEAARQAAFRMGQQVGDNEIMAWAYEMTAWFALVEERFGDASEAARVGREIAGHTSVGVQLTLQQARADARIGDRRAADSALREGAHLLGQLPIPTHPEHHFVFDHSKWLFYAASSYTALEDNDRAEEHALEVIKEHGGPDGTSSAPMRTADAQIDLAVVQARRGDLDAAIEYGNAALSHERLSAVDLIARTQDLDAILTERYRGERLAQDFHDRFRTTQQTINGNGLILP